MRLICSIIVIALLAILATEIIAGPLLFSFNSGELSPLMKYRVDQPAYASGCQKMENFVPVTQGAAIRRPGTKYVGTAKWSGETP